MLLRLRDGLLLGTLATEVLSQNCSQPSSPADLTWHPPNATDVNNLEHVVNGTGIDGFIFNSSITPATTSYGTYNWCNMPHVRAKEYPRAPQNYKLEYVEIVCGTFVSSTFFDIP